MCPEKVCCYVAPKVFDGVTPLVALIAVNHESRSHLHWPVPGTWMPASVKSRLVMMGM